MNDEYAQPLGCLRGKLPFRSVNRKGSAGYCAGMQRHHVLPRQLLLNQQFRKMFDGVDCAQIGFDDFRFNGLLLPALEQASLVLGLPLHRGPHRIYNEVVTERVGQIEARWSVACRQDDRRAQDEVLMRMRLLQRALRRRLLEPGWRRLTLNNRDPLGKGLDFSKLDAMADALWSVTDTATAAESQRL